jgi:CheY-like chemotaxis protein
MRRILLIADYAPVRDAVARLLTIVGYQVATAPNGAEGLRLWHKTGADLVLTEILLPDMNGIEVILELRTFAPRLPIIALSGRHPHHALELLGEAHLLGTVRLLMKPFSDQLLAEVTKALKPDPPAEPAQAPKLQRTLRQRRSTALSSARTSRDFSMPFRR